MNKIIIKMSYSGEKYKGQGVLSATLEQVNLIQNLCKHEFDTLINKRGKHDILHIHTVNPASFIGARNSKVPTVTHVHFLPNTLEGSIKLPRLFMRFFKNYFLKLYRNSDYLVVVNPSFIDELVKFDLEREKITYIPNFVSEEVFYKYNDEEKLRAKKDFDLDPNKFTVVGVGQVQHRKGVHDFVKTARKLPNVQFIWAGGFSFGKITDGYKELSKVMKNPPSNVRFLGIIDRDKMTDIFNAADLLFMPSYNELFPMAILEACSTETPILVRNLSLYEPVLLDGYYHGENNEDFVKIIHQLSTDKTYYDGAVEHALRVKDYYSRENIKKLWIEFYRGIHNKFIQEKEAKKQRKKNKKHKS